jgi:hypothetical protein
MTHKSNFDVQHPELFKLELILHKFHALKFPIVLAKQGVQIHQTLASEKWCEW